LSVGTYLIAFVAIQFRDKNIKKISAHHSPQIQNTSKLAQNAGIIPPQNNTSPPPISKKVENEKMQHKKQLDKFETLAKVNDWETFHNTHYDWWMFPIQKKAHPMVNSMPFLPKN
jgi:hypothetical protein